MKELSLLGQQDSSVGESACHQGWEFRSEHWNPCSEGKELISTRAQDACPSPTNTQNVNDECKFKRLRVPTFAWDRSASITFLARTVLQELSSVCCLLPGSLVGVATGLLEASAEGQSTRLASFSLGEIILWLNRVLCQPGLSVWIAIPIFPCTIQPSQSP